MVVMDPYVLEENEKLKEELKTLKDQLSKFISCSKLLPNQSNANVEEQETKAKEME